MEIMLGKDFVIHLTLAINSSIKGYHSYKDIWTSVTNTEEATGGILLKKVFLEISQNSQKSTVTCFPGNFPKFLRTNFLGNTSRRLLL